MSTPKTSPLPRSTSMEWVVTVFVVVGTLAFLFFGLAALLSPAAILPAGSVLNDATKTFAQYMAGRNLPLAIFVLLLLAKRERRMLGIALLLMGSIQAFDAVIGVTSHQVSQSIAPAILAVLYCLSGRYLLRNNKHNI